MKLKSSLILAATGWISSGSLELPWPSSGSTARSEIGVLLCQTPKEFGRTDQGQRQRLRFTCTLILQRANSDVQFAGAEGFAT